MSVLRHTAGIPSWTTEEICPLGRKTRKMMAMHGMLRPRANVARLYLQLDEGGRGLISAEECITLEEHGLSDYVKMKDKGFKILSSTMEKEDTKHETETAMENEDAKILWDIMIQTDQVITARRPDILVKDKRLDHIWLIDVAVPGDGRVKEKEGEKFEKYQDLSRELRKLWSTSVSVVLIVIGVLGAAQTEHRKKGNIYGAICCTFRIGKKFEESTGPPKLVVLTGGP